MKKEKDLYQVSLKLILKNRQGEILILKGHPNGTYAGFYDLPGGRIDTDEFSLPMEQIIAREVKEEIGDIEYTLNLKPVALGRHALTKNEKEIHILYAFFEAQYMSGSIETSKEHGNFEWVNLSEIDLHKYFKSGILEGIRSYFS